MTLQTIIAEGVIPVIKSIVVVLFPMIMVVIMIWFERRVVAFIQIRIGPNRVGFQGVLQPIADAVKLFLKEDIIPNNVDRLIFAISPVMVLFSGLVAFCFIPMGDTTWIGGYKLTFWIADSPVALILTLGLSSISVFGVIFAGWSSNSKYPLLGGLRSVIQILSYEIPVMMAVLSVIFFSKSMSLVQIVRAQNEGGIWYGFMLPVSFILFWIASVAETNRAPFDLPEAESELVAGFHTEYSGMKFGYFYMAEYAHMVLVSSLSAALFFGGWLPPFPNVPFLSFLHYVPGFVWYFLKIMVFLYLFVWIRGTFPRYRFDELIKLAWKWLVPLSILNILVIALIRSLL